MVSRSLSLSSGLVLQCFDGVEVPVEPWKVAMKPFLGLAVVQSPTSVIKGKGFAGWEDQRFIHGTMDLL